MGETVGRLQHFWSNFVSAELDSYEKKCWFDVFLSQFLLDCKCSENTPGDALFTNMSDVIAREFILDIHDACTQSNETDELEPLKKYFLNNRGWRCLAVLQLIGKLKLTNMQELCNLLISLFVLVEYEDCLNYTITNKYLPTFEQTIIDQMIEEKLNIIKRKTQNLPNKNVKEESHEFSKNNENDESNLLNLDSYLYSKLHLITTEDQLPLSSFQFGKGKAENCFSADFESLCPSLNELLKNDPILDVIESSVNSAEFRFLILGVLQKLCEKNQSPDTCEDIVEIVIKFALENLCTIQYRFSKQHDTFVKKIRSQLSCLLITCANKAKRCKKIIDTLAQNGIIPIFLQLLQEVTSSINKSESSNLDVEENLNFLYGLSCCILILFFQILRQDNIMKNLISFNKLYRQFIGCASGKFFLCLIKTFLYSYNGDHSVKIRRAKVVVTFFGLLIVRFKTLHRRTSHFEENYAITYEDKKTESVVKVSCHHNHLLGKNYKSLLLCPAALYENCCVTSTFVILLKVVLENIDHELTAAVLRILVYCGTCCCFPIRWFLPKLLSTFLQSNIRVKHLILLFMERTLYHDVGMYRNGNCDVCIISEERTSNVNKPKCFEEYKRLLIHEDSEVVRIVGRHLLKVFGNFSRDVQQYFINHVCNTVFHFAKDKYTASDRMLYKDSILVCLAIFGDLSVYRTFSAEIDELLPSKAIQPLLQDPNLNELCCKILETRIINKTMPLDYGGGNTFTPVLVESCAVELNVLLNVFNQCYDELLQSVDLVSDHLESTTEKMKLKDDIITIFAKTIDKNTLFYLKVIVYTLERLTMRSSVMKSYFYSHSMKNKFQNLLFLILRILTWDGVIFSDLSAYEDDDDIRLKLTQPLLIICLCLFDNTKIIENCVKDLLHEALQAGTISIKQVCDSLLSLNQVEFVHKENNDHINSAVTTAAILFQGDRDLDSSDYDDEDEELISWSRVESALSEVSQEDGVRLVLLLDNCSKSTLLYPTICTIAVDLINSLRVDQQCTEESLYCLQHISTICQRNSKICIELMKQNISSKLLDKLEESLKEELLTPEEADIQYAITQFLSILFYTHVERKDLRRFFNFMKKPCASLDHLVSTLVSVVDKLSTEISLSYYLTFPSTPTEHAVECDDPAEALAVSMRELQKQSAAASPWVICGVTLPLNTSLEWCIWLTGFSVSFWFKNLPLSSESFKYNRHADNIKYHDEKMHSMNDGMIHVISVGYDTMLLEMWIDEGTSCFVVRLSKPEGNTFEILSEAMFQKPLSDDLWHHIVLNVRDTLKKQKIALEISLTIDGFYEETCYLIFLGILVRKVRPACIMIGDTRSTVKASYNISNLMMFRAAMLSKECSLTIRAFGPDIENILICPANSLKPNFNSLMHVTNYDTICDFSIVNLIKKYEENMKQMQDNILISYTARKPECFHQYTQNDSANTMPLSMFTPTIPILFRKTKNTRSSQRVPHTVKAIMFSSIVAEHSQHFYDCIQELGGFSFIMFLFAKLIDLCQIESVQGHVLRLIIKSSFNDVRLYSQFLTFNGYNILLKVIMSPRFKNGRSAFIELTNIMCSKKNYFASSAKEFHVEDDVLLCNPEIITKMLLPYWKFWETFDSDLMVILFKGLYSLVLNSNIYKKFNTEQLISINVLEKTLDMCKEKFVFEEKVNNENTPLCSSILEFVRIMISSPASTDHIKSIIDYLYIVHPTSHSYCTHTPSGFYFLFSSLSSQIKQKQKILETTEMTKNCARELVTMSSDHDQGSIPYSPKLSKSLADLQDKRNRVNQYLRTSSLNLPDFDDEDFKDEKITADSGIEGSYNTDQETDKLLFCYDSVPYLTYRNNSDYYSSNVKNGADHDAITRDNIRKYSNLNFSKSFDNCQRTNHSNITSKGDCDQYMITAGLLDIIHDTIFVLPDNSVENIFKNVINYKLFLILANDPNASVRYSVVRVILAWLVRCDEEETVKFVSHVKGFYHLANQLAMYSATEGLVNACISLMARCHWDALEQISEMENMTLPSLDFSALPPLLAIFPGTVHNFRLAMNVIQFFKILINKISQALKKLIEYGLVESLVKIMLILIHSEDKVKNIEGNTVLLNDIIDLFALIVNTCIQTPGVLYLQFLNEIVYKCRYLEVTEEALCGTEECVQIIHNLHCNVLQSGLDTVLVLIEIHQSQDFAKGRHSPSFLTSMTGTMSASLSSIPSSLISFASSSGKQKHIPRDEMIDRYKLVINRATEYLLFSSSSAVTDKDMKFACHLFTTLINGMSHIVQNKPYMRIGLPWKSVYWLCRETVRTQASNLLIWMLAPVRPVHLHIYAIETLLNEMKTKEIISALISVNVETEQRFTIFLWHLMYSKSCDLSETDLAICEEFKNVLQERDLISPQAIGQVHDRWQFEVASALRELSVLYWSLEKSQQDAVYKCVYKSESLSKKLSDIALSISAAVVERQGRERKKFLNNMRNKYRLHVEARNRWRNIVQQMTHEQAPWFSSYIYPNYWELDPTEGPARVRKRLRQCKLNIDKKFFKTDYYKKIKVEENHPLAYLFENDDVQTLYTAALDSLSMDDTISYTCSATNVQPGYEVYGELLIGAKYLYFIATQICNEKVTVSEAEKFSLFVKFKDIKEIHNRRFQLKERAIELFLLNGKTVLIAFSSPMDRDNFISALSECSLPNRIITDMLLSDVVETWREGHTSNWEYLKMLNKMAGRSYNDLMQYPIMPFILADYNSKTIDLNTSGIYRNLKKPMAIQDKKKETHFINHYNYLKFENLNSTQNMPAFKQQPYHYASHYSNSGTVLHFLLRLPPFTQIFLQYQDNNFDLPDRTFHSLDTTWRLTSSESTTDVKELIPEFFYLPEFLLNLQNFNFGVRQNGERVENVKLPAWTNENARLFILVHRQMLESEYVRENLPHWIDLVFGYKQTGKAAIEAINVFHPATYYGFDVESIPDPLVRDAWETMVKTYGQTPRQLFRTPHPMIVQDLIQEDDENIPVVKDVRGLRWGNYVGSPSKQLPIVVWTNSYSCAVSFLVPLITNDVFGLPACTSLLLSYNKERSVNLINEGVTLLGAALLSWGYTDGIVRIKERKEQPLSAIIYCSPKDPISVCSTTPDCSLIWIGLFSGIILVFTYSFNAESGAVQVEPEPVTLVGHTRKVNCICLSQLFGIAVSASDDDYAIIWDLNEMTYIRTIQSIDFPLNIVTISETLGDIATVCDHMVLRLHTINATEVGSVTMKERISAICFSTAPEGVSVNVLATGLESGIIKLWSTWDLSPVTDIINTSISCPIISIAYSFDSQHLYASGSDGTVYIWESTNSSGVGKTPKFLNLTAVN